MDTYFITFFCFAKFDFYLGKPLLKKKKSYNVSQISWITVINHNKLIDVHECALYEWKTNPFIHFSGRIFMEEVVSLAFLVYFIQSCVTVDR